MLQIVMDAWGSPSIEDSSELYQRLGFLPFRGRVCLGDPDHTFQLIRASSQSNGGMPPMPLRWFFCRQARGVGGGGGVGGGDCPLGHGIGVTAQNPSQLAPPAEFKCMGSSAVQVL